MKKIFDLLLSENYFIIFLVVMMAIVLGLIIYLIKLQVSDKKEDVEIIEEMDEFLQKKREKAEEQKSIVSEVKQEVKVETPTEVSIQKPVQTNLKIDKDNIKYEETKDVVEEYEDRQEEEAVISASELENKLKTMKQQGKLPEHNINKYEEEQERKAIISYEELLNRASVKLNYKEEKREGLKVSKVEIDDPLIPPENRYNEEEEFLRALKEFRASLQ